MAKRVIKKTEAPKASGSSNCGCGCLTMRKK